MPSVHTTPGNGTPDGSAARTLSRVLADLLSLEHLARTEVVLPSSPKKSKRRAKQSEPQESFEISYPRLCAEARVAVARCSTEGFTPPRPSTRLAREFLRLAFAEGSGTRLGPCLAYLLALGPPGPALAIQAIRRNLLPFSVVEPALAARPFHERLLLTNQLFAAHLPGDHPLDRWCGELLSSSEVCRLDGETAPPLLQGQDPAACLKFLTILHRTGPCLSPALKEAFLARGLDSVLLRVFETSGGMERALAAEALDVLDGRVPARSLRRALTEVVSKGESPRPFLLLARNVQDNGPERAALCRTLAALLPHPNPEIGRMAMRALRDMGCTDIETACARILAKLGEDADRLTPVLGELPTQSLRRLSALLDEGASRQLFLRLFASLCRERTHFVSRHLERAFGRLPATSCVDFLELLAFIRSLAMRLQTDQLPPAPPRRGENGKSSSMLGGLGKAISGGPKDFSLLEKTFAANAFEHTGLDLTGGAATGVRVASTSLREARLTHGDIARSGFEQVTFRTVDFTGTGFAHCRFESCRFEDCTFSQALISHCTFAGCGFKQTRFTDAHLTGVEFEACTLEEVSLESAALVRTHLALCELAHVNAQEAVLHGVSLHSVNLDGCDLSGARLTQCQARGVRFTRSCLRGAELTGGRYLGQTFAATASAGMNAHDLQTDSGRLLTHLLADGGAPATRPPGETAPPPAFAKPLEGYALLRSVVEAAFEADDALRAEARFLAEGERRTRMVLETLSPERAEFYRLLPYLLQTNVFEEQNGLPNGPLCAVHGYAPDPAVWEASERLFEAFEPDDPPPDAVRVEGIYTIGSVGTLAMSEASDLDYWICVHEDDAAPQVLAALSAKLRDISTWARESVGLDCTFFVMNVADIRANAFGFSDKESSGTAQALLLKEEFYRTALRVAGKSLAWWVVPPGESTMGYAAVLHELADTPDGMAGRLLDLGPMAAIPAEEFFGASLWQIVKALKSPFKSIMKFGLLDRYCAGGAGGAGGARGTDLLCERLKANLLAGPSLPMGTDPYGLLFKEVRDYYVASGERSVTQLIDLSFFLKLGIRSAPLHHPAAPHLAAKRRLLEGFSREGNGPDHLAAIARHGLSDYLLVAKLGGLVNSFMLRTYESVRASSRADGAGEAGAGSSASTLSPEDMTRLGRKLFTAFAKRPHKVDRLPFLQSMRSRFTTLNFRADRAPGKQTIWIAEGVQGVVSSRRDNYRELRRMHEPAKLFTWLCANRLYLPETLLETDPSLSPIAARDARTLLDTLHEFFPHGQTFEVDLDNHLQPEHALKALLILNLDVKRDQQTLRGVDVVHATSWGELFCQRLELTPAMEKALRAAPRRFLASVLSVQVDDGLELRQFLPHGARLKRLTL